MADDNDISASICSLSEDDDGISSLVSSEDESMCYSSLSGEDDIGDHSEDEDDEAEDFLVSQLEIKYSNITPDRRGRLPLSSSSLSGAQYFAELLSTASEATFLDRTRMHRWTFVNLVDALERFGGLRQTGNVSTGEMLFMLSRVLSGWTHYDLVDRLHYGQSTVSKCIRNVVKATEAIADQCMHPPPLDVPAKITSSAKFNPYFKDCIGAMDGKHVPAIVPKTLKRRFKNHKGFTSQNVLLICGFDLGFNFVLTGWGGSATDSTVLRGALQRGFTMPQGKYFLGDKGFPIGPHVLTPYSGQRYGLVEFGKGMESPQSKEELFNLRHASLRVVVENAFGIVQSKFRILAAMARYSIDMQARLVMCAFVIYNFIHTDETQIPSDDMINVNNHSGRECEGADDRVGPAPATKEEAFAYRDRLAGAMWSDYNREKARREKSAISGEAAPLNAM